MEDTLKVNIVCWIMALAVYVILILVWGKDLVQSAQLYIVFLLLYISFRIGWINVKQS